MFDDERLVNLYDTLFLHTEDTRFYVELVDELSPMVVIDLGCGTGRLALVLSARGHRVVGVDPSSQMLAVARAKPGSHTVEWVHGGASDLGEAAGDLVMMTGHVAQFFFSDEEWRQALQSISRALCPGGRVAFETRNPTSTPWDEMEPARVPTAHTGGRGRHGSVVRIR